MAPLREFDVKSHTGTMGSGSSKSSSMITPMDNDGVYNDEDFFAYDDSNASITNSVRDFQKENGRTYHGYRAGNYAFPNDPTEADRLDFQYSIIQHSLKDSLHLAPLQDPKTVLDVGTGTGIWAIEMAELYPNARIDATDLSPIQPAGAPINVDFIVDDAEEEWTYPENHYDFIHARILMGCFHDYNEAIIQTGFKHIKPGGWMECSDVTMIPESDDGSMPADWPFKDWSENMNRASLIAQRPLEIANKLKQWFIEAGFVDVHEKVIKLPINTWPKNKEPRTLGKWWAENLLMGMEGFSLGLLSRVLGWSKDEIEEYLVNVRMGISDRRVHAYHKYYIVWGRKPEPVEPVEQPAEKPAEQPAEQANRHAAPSPVPSTHSQTHTQPIVT